MKQYRVVVINLGKLKRESLTKYKLIGWGIGNIDGQYQNCFARLPKAAVLRIRRFSPELFVRSCSDFSEAVKRTKEKLIFLNMSPDTEIDSLISELEEMIASNDIICLIGQFPDSEDGFAMLYGLDILPVNLATAESDEPLLKTLQILTKQKVTMETYDFTHHIVFSDEYLRRQRLKDKK